MSPRAPSGAAPLVPSGAAYRVPPPRPDLTRPCRWETVPCIRIATRPAAAAAVNSCDVLYCLHRQRLGLELSVDRADGPKLRHECLNLPGRAAAVVAWLPGGELPPTRRRPSCTATRHGYDGMTIETSCSHARCPSSRRAVRFQRAVAPRATVEVNIKIINFRFLFRAHLRLALVHVGAVSGCRPWIATG